MPNRPTDKPDRPEASRPRGLAELDQLEAVFAALAHPNRRQILQVLKARGGTMTSGELAKRFDCAWPTTTRHLSILADANLVAITKQGRQRHYRLNTETMTEVAGRWINRFAPPAEADDS